MAALFYVFVGGGLGSLCRYGLGYWLGHLKPYPYATFTANVLSCILLGCLIGWQLRTGLDAKYKWLLITGFCGGFSTFSTFSAETYRLIFEDQAYGTALLYIGLSLVLCLVAIFIGIRLTQ